MPESMPLDPTEEAERRFMALWAPPTKPRIFIDAGFHLGEGVTDFQVHFVRAVSVLTKERVASFCLVVASEKTAHRRHVGYPFF